MDVLCEGDRFESIVMIQRGEDRPIQVERDVVMEPRGNSRRALLLDRALPIAANY